MSGEQRTLSGYKSQIHEGTDFENVNEGKPTLDDSVEYVFRLKEFPRVNTFPQIKEKKDGTKVTIKVDKAICEFEEESTKNIVNAFFRVDSLNFSEEESFESGIVRFFKKIKTPLTEGVSPDWDKFFLVGMRFRGRVVIGKDDKKVPNGKYFLDVPTCRPILPSDKYQDAPASPAKPTATNDLLQNALFICKGCQTADDAVIRLTEAKVSADMCKSFSDAVVAGTVKFPI